MEGYRLDLSRTEDGEFYYRQVPVEYSANIVFENNVLVLSIDSNCCCDGVLSFTKSELDDFITMLQNKRSELD